MSKPARKPKFIKGISNGWMLQYDFHQLTIQLQEKKVVTKKLYFDRIEELLEAYREKKDALFMGAIPYNDNFHLYRVNFQELDLSQIDVLM